MTRKVILEKQIILFVIRYDIWNGTIKSQKNRRPMLFKKFSVRLWLGFARKILVNISYQPFIGFVEFIVRRPIFPIPEVRIINYGILGSKIWTEIDQLLSRTEMNPFLSWTFFSQKIARRLNILSKIPYSEDSDNMPPCSIH